MRNPYWRKQKKPFSQALTGPAVPMSSSVELQGFAVRRRSTRVLLRVRLLIKASDHNGDSYETTAETLSVNKHGARMRTQKPLLVGNYVLIVVTQTKRQQRARVIWRDLATDEYALSSAIQGTCGASLFRLTIGPRELQPNQPHGSGVCAKSERH
jgi:hypothetical protein